MEASMGFWGVVVRPGETVRCDPPGEFYYHISQIALEPGELNENVQVFVEVDGKRTLLGTLLAEHCPQLATDLVFEKEFELLHTSKTYTIFFSGYQAEDTRGSDSPTKEGICSCTLLLVISDVSPTLGLMITIRCDVSGDESDEEVPLAIPLYPNSDDDKIKEAQYSPSKLAELKSAAAASPIPKAVVEERKNYGKSKADDDDSGEEDGDSSGESESSDDEDMIDEQDSSDDESSDEEETPSKNTEGKNRPVETPLKRPPQKKAKLATPIMDSKAGTVTGKRSGYVHVATPHPAKQAKKTPASNDMPQHSSGYVHVATPYPAKQAKKTSANNGMSKHSGYACKSCHK
ncbi:hypothetical protein E2562_007526 [Oryza meyeriana var. granulata]|nr:hypothetical protein E2562_007526 [Oryza meyeriana var. granulata]